MPADIHKLIAAISPDIYCDPKVRSKVKKLVKEKGYLNASKEAKPFKSDVLFKYDAANSVPLKAWGLKSPSETHEIIYDSPTDGLEPLYFWLLDFLNKTSGSVDKLTDNFTSSTGSGYFSELSGKATRMQDESMKILGAVNQIIKSILNIVYDLKEFKMLLDTYDELKSENPAQRSSALLSLKQRWMDTVDMKRGAGSINGLAQQLQFVTIRDAFMSVRSLEGVKEIDLNERVRRILEQKVGEFFRWIKESEIELRKRFEIEKSYLKSQVNTVKLYSRWVKPYLKAASELEQKTTTQAGLINTFNTIILELTLMAKDGYDPVDDVNTGILPATFAKTKNRSYTPFVIIEFKFRGFPSRTDQRGGYSYAGRTEIKFTSYALNDQELRIFKEEMDKDDLGEVLKLIEGTTTESLDQLKGDIEEFLGEKKEKKEKPKSNTQDVNPFSSLFSFMKTPKKKTENEDLSKGIRQDNQYEKIIRSQAIIAARGKCFSIFDTYKKAHGMPSHYDPYEPL